MKISRTSDESPARGGNPRNLDPSVEEIRILKAIKDMTWSLEDIESKNHCPDRLEYYV